jgi:two-component system, OmpR family, sensor kinase
LGDCVLAGRVITADLAAMQRFAGWLVAAGGAVLALGLWGGWLLATRAIRPVEVISATASRISEGNLSERISVADTDNELGHLAGVLNSTFARLEAAFAQQKQFTADASHELRTPLTVLISEAQTALARDRSAAEYRETVEACLDTAQQMRRLAESLLQLARFDAGQERMERNTIDLAEMTRVC